MADRKPTAYCSACQKHVLLNNQGTIMYHITSGKPCPGSDKKGSVTPGGDDG